MNEEMKQNVEERDTRKNAVGKSFLRLGFFLAGVSLLTFVAAYLSDSSFAGYCYALLFIIPSIQLILSKGQRDIQKEDAPNPIKSLFAIILTFILIATICCLLYQFLRHVCIWEIVPILSAFLFGVFTTFVGNLQQDRLVSSIGYSGGIVLGCIMFVSLVESNRLPTFSSRECLLISSSLFLVSLVNMILPGYIMYKKSKKSAQ